MRKQKISFSGIAGLCLLAIAMGCTLSLFAQQHSPTVKEQLKVASKQMAADSNVAFIIAEAISDSLIKEGYGFEFIYKRGIVTIDNRKLPEPYQLGYARKMEAFFRYIGQPDSYYQRLTQGGVTIAEILDPDSKFRTRADRLNRPATNYNLVLYKMVEAGLADTSKHISLVYDYHGLRLNGKPLGADDDMKYRQMFRDLYHYPRAVDTAFSLSIESYPDKPGKR